MSLIDIDIRMSYETEESRTNLVEDFYVPVLRESNKYCRIAGYFSSSSLTIAARGIEGLIHNDGRMLLLISPELTNDDYSIIKQEHELSEKMDLFSELEFDEMADDNLKALAWLLDNDKLEIRIVVSKISQDSLFHQKVGIFYDEVGNAISFSGSINESAHGWLTNIEEFKVFKSWEPGQREYLDTDLEKFSKYWNNEKKEIAYVFDIPDAVKNKIVKIKPKDINELDIMKDYKNKTKKDKIGFIPFDHQKEACDMWFDNDKKLLMEMATGTGKTRAAIYCISKKLEDNETLLVIVSTPQITLSTQWKEDIDQLNIDFEEELVLPGKLSSREWKKELELLMRRMGAGVERAIVFTTHNTASSSDFIDIINETKKSRKILFICDEVHAIGSKKRQNALIEGYDYRIGLSATPERMFDEIGTNKILDYFGGKKFEFPIEKALNTINPETNAPFLNQYYYYPIFVELTDREEKDYAKLTQKIFIIKNQDDYDEEKLEKLYLKRAAIIKDAENKKNELYRLLKGMDPTEIKNILLFVSDKQLNDVMNITADLGISRAKITENEDANRIINEEGETERTNLINKFRNEQLKILIGLKCLDEGIDIKNARTAILMSNSTNPREYIQRIGRVIRYEENKLPSIIYDFIADSEKSGILEKESRRVGMIAKNSINYKEVKRIFRRKGVSIDAN